MSLVRTPPSWVKIITGWSCLFLEGGGGPRSAKAPGPDGVALNKEEDAGQSGNLKDAVH